MFAPTLLLVMFAAAPEVEVVDLVKGQVEAWNRGDLPGFCALYADDALFLSPSGVTRGRKAVEERYAKKYGGNKKGMGTLAIEPIETRALPKGDKALVVSMAAKWSLTFADKAGANGLTLIVFEKRGHRWILIQDASM